MANTYTEVFFHFVWATKNRDATITEALEETLYNFIRHKCRELNADVHALNGLADHVHLCCTLPVSLSVAEFIKTIKGTSSHFVNHLPENAGHLEWQPGYGALTFAKHDLPRIVAYIEDQKNRHAVKRLSEKMERLAF